MNRRNQIFKFRVNQTERMLIREVAERLERSQSDALRFLVRGAARELDAPIRELSNREYDEPQSAH